MTDPQSPAHDAPPPHLSPARLSPAGLSIAEAAGALAAKRAASGGDVSAAARMLSRKAAEARLARRAEAAGAAMGAQDEDAPAGDLPAENAPADSSAEAPPGEATGGADAGPEFGPESGPEPGDAPDAGETLIDLGDGVQVTLDQVREGFMLKADHTRKTQALADERRALEAMRGQKLAALDAALQALQREAVPMKGLQAYLAEDPANGLQRFAQQVDRLQRLAAARETARQQRGEHMAAARAARDRRLAQDYWRSAQDADAGIAAATAYAQGYGYDAAYLAEAMIDPTVVAILDKARQFDELQAGRARVSRMVADKPKVVRPGAKVSAQAASQSAAQAARSRLRSSGTLSDAVAYLQAQRKARGD